MTLFVLLFSFLTLTSCGVKKNSKSDVDDNTAYIEAALSSKSCGGEKVLDLNSRITALEESLRELKIVDPILKPQKRNFKSNKSSSPIILSEVLIEESIEDIQNVITSKSETTVTNSEFREIKRRVQKLRINFDRWSFHQCHLTNLIDNNAKELNDFIELETMFCEENCLSTLMPDREILQKEKREKTINICSLFKRKSYCRVHYDIASIYGGEDEFVREILKQVRIFFNQEVFGMNESPLEIECEQTEKKILTIPIYQNSNSVSLMNAILENWKRDDIEVKFKLGSRGARLELVDAGLSRVSLNDLSTIYLNKSLFGTERVKTIAHEFGHTLGFKDCYIEYFDTKSGEVVYYELERDKGNLMCSLEFGTKIPEKYLEKVVSKYCK